MTPCRAWKQEKKEIANIHVMYSENVATTVPEEVFHSKVMNEQYK